MIKDTQFINSFKIHQLSYSNLKQIKINDYLIIIKYQINLENNVQYRKKNKIYKEKVLKSNKIVK